MIMVGMLLCTSAHLTREHTRETKNSLATLSHLYTRTTCSASVQRDIASRARHENTTRRRSVPSHAMVVAIETRTGNSAGIEIAIAASRRVLVLLSRTLPAAAATRAGTVNHSTQSQFWLSTVLTLCVFAVGSVSLQAETGARAGVPAASSPPTQAPASLTAESSSGRVMLDWTPVRGAHAYRVFRAVAGVWSPEPIATVSFSRFINFRLTNGTVYSYKVVAFNRGGNGPESSVVEAKPLAAPTALTATAGDRQITLAWQASPGAMSYAVFRKSRSRSLLAGRRAHDCDDARRQRSDQRHAFTSTSCAR